MSDEVVARAGGSGDVQLRGPDDPPLAILVDFDGTIAQVDVCDQILLRFAPDNFAEETVAYDTGRIGSRELSSGQVPRLPSNPAPLLEFAARLPYDTTFAPFVGRALGLGVPVEVVSDGFGFYVAPALERLGVPPIPVSTNRTVFGGARPRLEFPSGHPDCFVCGTCKRQRVLAYQETGRAVVFVGDGESDRYAVSYADIIFAKRGLIDFCRARGLAFTPWQDFSEIEAWLEAAVGGWRDNSASIPAPAARPFICGPEVWGPGRSLSPQPEPPGIAGAG